MGSLMRQIRSIQTESYSHNSLSPASLKSANLGEFASESKEIG
jgi:hypothetical protein